MSSSQESQWKIRLVCATRESTAQFFEKTALGRSLRIYKSPMIELRLFPQNASGLSTVYNHAIEEAQGEAVVLAFMHDDIHLCDFFWPNHVMHALERFDVVGLAGNKRRVARQPSWAFIDDRFTWDKPENLSGMVGHGRGFPPDVLSFYGPPFQQVKLLDGLMLACHSDMLHKRNIRFDPRFAFHFYDMDFCRQADALGVTMGTCAISVIHESGGSFGSPAWRSSFEKYLAKWES